MQFTILRTKSESNDPIAKRPVWRIAAATGVFLLCFIVSGTSILWFSWLRSIWYRGDFICLTPQLAVVPNVVLEYDVPTVRFSLDNNSSQTVVLESLVGSCGCLKFDDENGKPLLLPSTISANGQLPIRLNIRTGGAIGRQEYQVLATLNCGGEKVTKQAQAVINVAAGIRSNPSFVRFDLASPSSAERSEVFLYDNYPNDGVDIADIRTTRPDLLSTRSLECDSDGTPSIRGLKLRLKVSLSLTSEGAHLTDETYAALVVRPASTSHPVVEVPIVINPPKPVIRFVPSSIFIPLQNSNLGADDIVVRTVRCYMTDRAGDLKVVSNNPGVRSKIVATSDPKEQKLEIQAELAQIDVLKPLQIVLRFSETPKLDYVIPVHFIASD